MIDMIVRPASRSRGYLRRLQHPGRSVLAGDPDLAAGFDTGRRVWVRWDGHLVRVFNSKMESIAVHVQVEPGTFQTQDQHLHAKKVSQVEKGTVWLLRRSAIIGTHAEQWARQMLEARGVAGVRVLVGLLSLTRSHSRDEIDQACAIALTHGAIRLRTIRQLLERGGPVQQQFAFLDEHPIIRPMADYGSVVQNALGTEADQERSLSQKGVPR